MFYDRSIIWELENNREVKTITEPHEFTIPENFTTLGIECNVKNKNKNM